MNRAAEVTIGLAVIALYAAFMAWVVSKAWPDLFDFAAHAAIGLLGLVIVAAVGLYHSIKQIPDYVPLIAIAVYVIYARWRQ